ncbi:DUF4007 family protein [Desulfallas sp. Bu1-1]|uniref:DUF4007 family protein n=1 Tax=Desulfallas sp. Bu1-1 TaxID=2787620 RepID=UPI0018A0433F|nr:DUF4007 family protein [Desulfallas sp. Bu1-1]MBF7081861.1 DUF4007 family protein [Desulfallas sp. Bu1-1]
MRFRAHDTFFIRKGWLNKGMRNVQYEPGVFMGAAGNPMDVLGIGANMVKALRYWLQAVGLTIESKGGRRTQKLTPLGEIVFHNDPYTEEIGTLWLLHYRLATNKTDATAWYFFFNEFRPMEFTRDDFVLQLSNYIRMQGEEISTRSLEDDFNCIINTYVPRIKSNPQKVQPESNIDCPLGELGLIDIVNKKQRIYKKCTPKRNSIHPLILLAVILDQSGGKKEIRISALQNELCNVGKVFNLNIISLTHLLTRIEHMGLIKVIRTAGLDVIRIETDMEFLDCVDAYYASINQLMP